MPYSDKYRGGGRHNALQNTSGNYDPYGTTIPTREFNGDTTIDTYSSEETRQYLAKRANDVYIDPDAKSTDDNTTERLITREQQVVLRHLQPPTLPPPGVMKQTIYRFNFTNLYMILATLY
jgi:hypothetical protein